jgi:biotin-(acetyl-CoA carboxylase) ligase
VQVAERPGGGRPQGRRTARRGCLAAGRRDRSAGRRHASTGRRDRSAGRRDRSARRDRSVVGVGINCNWPADWPPRDDPDAAAIAAGATSLDRVAGRPVDPDAVAERLLDRVAQRYLALDERPNAARSLSAEYRRNLSTIGQLVRVELAGETFVGRALDVNDAGHLLVDVGACVRTVSAGDVVHVRGVASGP